MAMTFTDFHNQMMAAKDVDPAVRALTYLANRYELNTEQRYWLAWLYGTCYCAPTVFYMYNEFPDYELVNVNRLRKWWSENRSKLIFQTDRARIKNNNQFIDSFISYRSLCRGSQEDYLYSKNWQQIYGKIEAIKYFGRFTLFNYLDVLNQITDIQHKPTYLNMAEAESCRNGVAYAIGREDLVSRKLTGAQMQHLHNAFINLKQTHSGNVFEIETTLCAYKKYRWGKRYVGYYIERMRQELNTIQGNVPQGVAWEALWQFRFETFDKQYLKEYNDGDVLH
jgi:hypothetical protein